MKKRLSEKMKSSRTKNLKKRAQSLDQDGMLSEYYHTEYFYSDDIDFIQLFTCPEKSSVIDAYLEARDNHPGYQNIGGPTLLVFCRPGGIVFCMNRLPNIKDGYIKSLIDNNDHIGYVYTYPLKDLL